MVHFYKKSFLYFPSKIVLSKKKMIYFLISYILLYYLNYEVFPLIYYNINIDNNYKKQ